jgi:hypothetical protein
MSSFPRISSLMVPGITTHGVTEERVFQLKARPGRLQVTQSFLLSIVQVVPAKMTVIVVFSPGVGV